VDQDLESPQRLQGLVPEVVAALKLKSGMLVADIGAGTGVFSPPLARAVRPGGKLRGRGRRLLEHIVETGTEQGVTNIEPVFGEMMILLTTRELVIHDVLHRLRSEVF
jgi:precorrin-6B methylase 2